jgi:aminopeptidase-like protein
LKKKKRKYSYRAIIDPRYFAAAAYLSKRAKSEIERIYCGFILSGLGNRKGLCFQTSHKADSFADKVTKNVFENYVPKHKIYPFRTIYKTDEIFYSSSNFNIPTVGINGCPYDQYRTHMDNLDLVDVEELEREIEIILKIIEVFETDYIPILKYSGILPFDKMGMCRREEAELAEKFQLEANGKSCFEIAYELGTDFFKTRKFFDGLQERALIEKQETPALK